MKWIIFSIGIFLTSSVETRVVAETNDTKVSVSINNSTLSINEYTLDINNLDAELEKFGIKPITSRLTESSFEKEQYPITFSKWDDEPIYSLIITYGRTMDNYSQVNIRVGNMSINNETSAEEFETLLRDNTLGYTKQVTRRGISSDGFPTIYYNSCFCPANPFDLVRFITNQIDYVNLDLTTNTYYDSRSAFWWKDASAFSTSCTHALPKTLLDESISIVLCDSILTIDGYKFNLESLESDIAKHGLAVIREEEGVMIRESSFGKDKYPISFIKNNYPPYMTVYISFDARSNDYCSSVIQLADTKINCTTTIGDIEDLYSLLNLKYEKMVGDNDTVMFCTHYEHLSDRITWTRKKIAIESIGFISNKIAFIKLNLIYSVPE